jgi:putative hydrolase of the HAD superfamily
MSPVRVVLLDIGGVLVSEGPMTWGEEWGVDAATLESVLGELDPDDGTTVGRRDEHWLRTALAARLGLDGAEADRLMAAMWDWYCGTPDEAMLAWVRGLAGRVRVAGLSNSADGARREEERRYGLTSLLDPILYSHEIGLRKPEPAIYRHACEALGVQPEEIVFVDDRPENVQAAREAGMHAVQHSAPAVTIAAVEELLAAPRVAP